MSNFVDTLKEFIIENDLNQLELAKILNVKPATVTRYILGRQYPDIDIAIKIADYFNCSLDYLFGLDEDNTEKTFRTCPEFSVRFSFLLEHFNKTIKEIYKETSIAKSTMYYWISGERNPSMINIIKLARYFDCSIEYVLGRVDFN